MKKLIIITILILFCRSLYAQGFDWQYSSRLPADYPDFYAGLLFDYGIYFHNGTFDFLQDFLPCCTYENGRGYSPSFGAFGEYWAEPYLALNFGIIYDNIAANFERNVQIPDTALIWNERYVSNSNLHYLTLKPGIKYRLLESHFNLGAQLNASFLISVTDEHFKESLTPERPYSDGSFRHEFENGKIPDPAILYIYPSVYAGYDISLGKGVYATPFISGSFPLYNLGSRGSWYPVSVSAGFTILYGLNID